MKREKINIKSNNRTERWQFAIATSEPHAVNVMMILSRRRRRRRICFLTCIIMRGTSSTVETLCACGTNFLQGSDHALQVS
jgi:hypothetical protein